MMKKSQLFWLVTCKLCFVWVVVFTSVTTAQVYTGNTYYYAAGTATSDTSNYDVNEGDTVDVAIYLREELGDPSNDFLLVDEGGLISAGVELQWSLDAGSGALSTVQQTSDVTANPAFNDPGSGNPEISLTTNDAGVLEVRDFFEPSGVEVSPNPPSGDVASIYLGTFTFTGGAADVTTLVDIVDYSAEDDTVTWNTLIPLDDDIDSNSFTITTPIPEPVSLLMFGSAGSLLLLRRRRS